MKKTELENIEESLRKNEELELELNKCKRQYTELHRRYKELEEKYDELSAINDAINHSIGWRIVRFPGAVYSTFVNKVLGNSYVKALNINNIKFVLEAFKNGGIKQVKREMNAFRLRQMGIDAAVEAPQLYELPLELDIQFLEKIYFKKCEKPKVSIIIPVYNQFAYTYNCLRTIYENSRDVDYETIIADDCSNDQTTRIAEVAENITVARTDNNVRFLLNCNNAAKRAKGQYILFLNNDTQVMDNWLMPLITLMESDDKIGMVGSKLIYPDGTLQEAGGILWNDGSAWNFGNGQNPESPQFNYVKEADYISGAAIMVKKSLWEEIGGFDERFAPAYYEDTDLAFEVRKHGYKVMYQPLSVVVHFEGKSNGTDTSAGLKAYQVENAKKFFEKWKTVLEDFHYPNGENVLFARDRSQKKKHILVVDHYIPRYDKDAGGRCTFMYLQHFVKMGMQVTFIGDNFAQEEPYKTELLQMGIEILYGNFYSQHWREWLAENGEKFDYVYLQRPHISIKYLDDVKKYCNGKIFYFAHDLHHLRERREYEITHDKKLLESSEKWKKIEFKIIENVDVVHVVGSYEQKYLQEIYKDIPIRNIPLYIYDDLPTDIQKDFEKREDIVFVGGFGHPPNIDAVEWFAHEIYPKVLEKYPDMKWHIVGNKPTKEIKKLASKNIIVHGFLSDDELVEMYNNCRLAVVPLRYGAGVKGKIVEAAYYQIPMVTTPIGAEGMSTDENTMIVKESADDLANAILDIYEDFGTLREMSDNGKVFIEKYFSNAAVESVLTKDLNV